MMGLLRNLPYALKTFAGFLRIGKGLLFFSGNPDSLLAVRSDFNFIKTIYDHENSRNMSQLLYIEKNVIN